MSDDVWEALDEAADELIALWPWCVAGVVLGVLLIVAAEANP